MQVWKYPLLQHFGITQQFEMPIGAALLHCQLQNNVPAVWALVDPKAATAPRRFIIIGTGHDIEPPPDHRFVHCGTFLTADDMLVWHVFEIAPRIDYAAMVAAEMDKNLGAFALAFKGG